MSSLLQRQQRAQLDQCGNVNESSLIKFWRQAERSGNDYSRHSVPDRRLRVCLSDFGIAGQQRRYVRTLGTLRREVLEAEWLYTTKQARIIINTWLRQYNRVSPRQALNTRPPIPETLHKSDL
ncbi:integrase core domain-containing protein [Litoreibacter roseus]|uniref:integrase core domain-containing protein n=1 Tax=Litoreibacter roseus TaxID=2601869 RepID=UPI001358C6A5